MPRIRKLLIKKLEAVIGVSGTKRKKKKVAKKTVARKKTRTGAIFWQS